VTHFSRSSTRTLREGVIVDGRRYSPERLREAITAAKTRAAKLDLLVEQGDFYRAYALSYREGEKYSRLEHDPSRSDLLVQILKPRVPLPARAKK
jgi:hypothetical protein